MLAQFERLESELELLRQQSRDMDARQSHIILQHAAHFSDQIAEIGSKVGVVNMHLSWLMSLQRQSRSSAAAAAIAGAAASAVSGSGSGSGLAASPTSPSGAGSGSAGGGTAGFADLGSIMSGSSSSGGPRPGSSEGGTWRYSGDDRRYSEGGRPESLHRL